VKKRVIMRLEVLPFARDGFAEIVDRKGSTNVVVLSRLIEWFVDQDEMIQAAVLELLPEDENRDIAREVITKLPNATTLKPSAPTQGVRLTNAPPKHFLGKITQKKPPDRERL
jgi:hypothetical protein